MVPANNPSEVSRLGFIEPCLLVRRSVMWTCPRAGMPLVAKNKGVANAAIWIRWPQRVLFDGLQSTWASPLIEADNLRGATDVKGREGAITFAGGIPPTPWTAWKG
jgi:hypothetical protein